MLIWMEHFSMPLHPFVHSNLPLWKRCAIIRWRLNFKISTLTEITEQQGQYLGFGRNFCIYPVNQGYANEIIDRWYFQNWQQIKAIMLFVGCWRWFDNIIWFSPSALILQQTVFEAGHTKLKMEKASLVFHLFEKRFCEDCGLVFYCFKKKISLKLWKIFENASLVFHLLEKNYFLKIMEVFIL